MRWARRCVARWGYKIRRGLQRLHVHHARHRLDRTGDLRGNLESSRELHLHLGLENEHVALPPLVDIGRSVGAGPNRLQVTILTLPSINP